VDPERDGLRHRLVEVGEELSRRAAAARGERKSRRKDGRNEAHSAPTASTDERFPGFGSSVTAGA
jgi:hypothetical protein